MRWSYILPRLMIVGLLWGFLAYGVDPLLRYSTVQSFQAVTGAKVDVAELQTTYFPPSFSIRGMALASASRHGKNMVQFDEMHVKFEPHALSRRRFVIENGYIDGLRFDTNRSDDGQLEIAEEPDPENAEPSWVTEKLTELGDEWLSNMEAQIRHQIDPNNLETYRLGTAVYEKWDAHFRELVARAKEFEPRAKALKTDFENAKKGDTLSQIEQYLAVAQEAEILARDAQAFREELTGIKPEVRDDFQLLNAARLRDQEKVKHTLALLKPDPRRISEALLGDTMYRRIQEILSWVELIREYQDGLQDQIQPPRRPGRDFDFWAGTESPDFLFKNLRLTGTISVNSEAIPFKAVLSDVTEDPVLLGRPCVMSLVAAGSRPLNLKVTYDATKETPVAEILADFRDTNAIPIRAGKAGKACLHAVLNDVTWQSRLMLVDNRIEGHLAIDSRLDEMAFTADKDLRPEIVEGVNEAFSHLRTLNALVQISGTLREPNIELDSDVGEQVAEGVKVAFLHQLHLAKAKVMTEVTEYADEQVQMLTSRFTGEYSRLLEDNQELISKAMEVKTLVASLRSGNVYPRGLMKQVSNSSFIKEADRKKMDDVMERVDSVMSGQIPSELRQKIPKLRGNFPMSPDLLPMKPGNLPLQPGSFGSLLPSRPKQQSPELKTKP